MAPSSHSADDRPPHDLALATRKPFRESLADSGLAFDHEQLLAIDAICSPFSRGFYLWGGVGRGKSLLAQRYFDAIPVVQKRRFHFHDFFRELQNLIAGAREPLGDSIQRLFGDARALMFDEFHVHDVADGIYLSATVDAVISRGLLLVATSNYAPEALMPNPLHHERSLPMIAAIRDHLEIVHLGEGRDYRCSPSSAGDARVGFAAGSWRIDHSPPTPVDPLPVDAAGFVVMARHLDGTSAEFAFDELFLRPLGVVQYHALTHRFRTVTVVAVPELATVTREPLTRFAHFVEVMYDRGVTIHIVAMGEPTQLWAAAEPPRDAARTASRLSVLHR